MRDVRNAYLCITAFNCKRPHTQVIHHAITYNDVWKWYQVLDCSTRQYAPPNVPQEFEEELCLRAGVYVLVEKTASLLLSFWTNKEHPEKSLANTKMSWMFTYCIATRSVTCTEVHHIWSWPHYYPGSKQSTQTLHTSEFVFGRDLNQ